MIKVMMWLVLYDINYIYRWMTPRFVHYDEVVDGKIKQSFPFWWLDWWQNKNFTFPFHFFRESITLKGKKRPFLCFYSFHFGPLTVSSMNSFFASSSLRAAVVPIFIPSAMWISSVEHWFMLILSQQLWTFWTSPCLLNVVFQCRNKDLICLIQNSFVHRLSLMKHCVKLLSCICKCMLTDSATQQCTMHKL